MLGTGQKPCNPGFALRKTWVTGFLSCTKRVMKQTNKQAIAHFPQRPIWHWLAIGLISGIGLVSPRPAIAAERVTTFLNAAELSVSIDDLEAFANNDTLSEPLAQVAAQFDEQQVQTLRQLLRQHVTTDPTTLNRFASAPMLEALLTRLGRAVQTQDGENGAAALRTALVLSASDPDGLSVIDVLRRFPDDEVRVNLASLLRLTADLSAEFI